jgi:hypothetical protein
MSRNNYNSPVAPILSPVKSEGHLNKTILSGLFSKQFLGCLKDELSARTKESRPAEDVYRQALIQVKAYKVLPRPLRNSSRPCGPRSSNLHKSTKPSPGNSNSTNPLNYPPQTANWNRQSSSALPIPQNTSNSQSQLNRRREGRKRWCVCGKGSRSWKCTSR